MPPPPAQRARGGGGFCRAHRRSTGVEGEEGLGRPWWRGNRDDERERPIALQGGRKCDKAGSGALPLPHETRDGSVGTLPIAVACVGGRRASTSFMDARDVRAHRHPIRWVQKKEEAGEGKFYRSGTSMMTAAVGPCRHCRCRCPAARPPHPDCHRQKRPPTPIARNGAHRPSASSPRDCSGSHSHLVASAMAKFLLP